MRQMIIDKLILETDGGLTPKRKKELQERYEKMTDQTLLDELWDMAWDDGYDDGHKAGYEG